MDTREAPAVDAKSLPPEVETALKEYTARRVRKLAVQYKAAGIPPECHYCKTAFTSWKARREHVRGCGA